MISRVLLTSLFISLIPLANCELRCWKCASVEQRKCPENAVIVPTSSLEFNACVIWRLGNGTVILQNMVSYEEECTISKIAFWSNFINMYYGGNEVNSASVECCKEPGCNSGVKQLMYPGPPLDTASLPQILPRQTQTRFIPDILRRMDGSPTLRLPYNPYQYESFLRTSATHNPIKVALEKVTKSYCKSYFSSSSGEEWIPKHIIPLTLDRASGAKVSVFYAKFNSLQNNNDHLIVRIMDDSKSNATMYTFKLYHVGSVSLFVSEYRKDNEQETRKKSANKAIKLSDETFHGFWISIRDEEIALGKVGDTLIDPVIIWNDTDSKGPRHPSFMGITTPKSSSASFGASCESQSLHFEDTCITDEECDSYANTVCRKTPLEPQFDQGSRKKPFDKWDARSSILKSCFCQQGHIRIPDSKGCYDPIRSVVTLKEACFSDKHCESLPNTACNSDYEILLYNRSCQCLLGYKPFNPDPKTGLIEGCSLLTESEKLSVFGCLERFKIDTSERVPSRLSDFEYDEDSMAYIGVVQIKFDTQAFDENPKNAKGYSDVAVVKILDGYKSGDKMLSVSFDRTTGRIAIEDTLRSRGFFFENDYTREKVGIDELKILRRMEEDFIGFWIMYSYKKDVGGTLSIGLNGSPIDIDSSLISWKDSSDSAIDSPRYLGFTSEHEGSTVHFGANCVIKKNPPPPFLDSTQSMPRIKSSLSNPWLAQPDSLNGWQMNPDPLLQQQYLEQLSKILPQYYDDVDDDNNKSHQVQSLFKDIEPLKTT